MQRVDGSTGTSENKLRIRGWQSHPSNELGGREEDTDVIEGKAAWSESTALNIFWSGHLLLLLTFLFELPLLDVISISQTLQCEVFPLNTDWSSCSRICFLLRSFLSKASAELATGTHLLHACKYRIAQLFSPLQKGRAAKCKKLDTHHFSGQAIYHST